MTTDAISNSVRFPQRIWTPGINSISKRTRNEKISKTGTSRSLPSLRFMRMVGSLRSSTTETLVASFRLVLRIFFVFQKNMKLRRLWQFSVIGSKV